MRQREVLRRLVEIVRLELLAVHGKNGSEHGRLLVEATEQLQAIVGKPKDLSE